MTAEDAKEQEQLRRGVLDDSLGHVLAFERGVEDMGSERRDLGRRRGRRPANQIVQCAETQRQEDPLEERG